MRSPPSTVLMRNRTQARTLSPHTDTETEPAHSPQGRGLFTVDPDDYLSLGAVSFQSQVLPYDEIAVDVNVESNWSLLDSPVANARHPDYCTTGIINATPGGLVTAVVSVNGPQGGDQDSTSACVSSQADRETLSTQILAPAEPGSFTVEVELVGAESGEVYDSYAQGIQVQEPPNGGNGGGDNGDDDDDGDDDNGDDRGGLPDPGDGSGDVGDPDNGNGGGGGGGLLEQTLNNLFGVGGNGGGLIGTRGTVSVVAVAIILITLVILTR